MLLLFIIVVISALISLCLVVQFTLFADKGTKKRAKCKINYDLFSFSSPSPPNDEPEIFVYSPDLNLSFSKLISDI